MKEKIIFLVFVVHGILSSPSNKTETNDYDPNYDDGDQWIFWEENSYKKSVEHIAQELYFGFAEELDNNFAFSPLRYLKKYTQGSTKKRRHLFKLIICMNVLMAKLLDV